MHIVLGVIYAVCFTFAGIPGAVACARAGRNPGIPVSTAWLIFVGTLVMWVYLCQAYMLARGVDVLVTINTVVEAGAWGTVLWFSYRPRAR